MNRRAARGFSLIELMVAVVLGLVAIAAVGSVFVLGSRNYKQDDKVSRMQDELRFGMAQLAADVEMTGFFAQIRAPAFDIDVDSSATVSNDCGPTTNAGAVTPSNTWTYAERRAFIDTLGNVTGSGAAAVFPCIASADIVDGTDVLAIKRLGAAVATPVNNAIYLRTNGVDSTIYLHQTAVTPPAPSSGSIVVYEYKPSIWYIAKQAFSGQSPAVPSLCRKYLDGNGGAPEYKTECVAQGIQDMQLEFGLDSATAPDGIADAFVEVGSVPGGTPAERTTYLNRIVSVRIHLLGRSSEKEAVGYVNAKTYTLAGKTVAAANDGYYRRVQTALVLLRNPANRLNPFALPNS